MCQLLPIAELENLKWAISSLRMFGEKGSNEKEVMNNAVRGICCRIDWVIENLKKSNEGKTVHAK